MYSIGDHTPPLVSYRGAGARVEVVLSNLSDRCVTIQPSAVSCESQKVELADNQTKPVQLSTVMGR